MQEREHILSLLKRAKESMKKNDVVELKSLSNQTVHSASIFQDEDNILVAVFLYSLSKIIERGQRYYQQSYHKYLRYYYKSLDKLINFSRKKDDDNFKKEIKLILETKEISSDFKQNMKDLFRKAQINKASKVYEHGLSMEKTAKLLGISLWELAEYSGQTGVSEVEEGKTLTISQRLKNAMEIFS